MPVRPSVPRPDHPDTLKQSRWDACCMPDRKTIICRECGEPFALEPRKPGLVDVCPRCLAEKRTFIDPIGGFSEKLRRALYAECDKLGLDGDARNQWLREWVRDSKQL